MDPIIAAGKYYSDYPNYTDKRNKRVKTYYYYVYQNKSGVKSNIIPDKVSLEGTMRYLYKGGEKNEEKLEKRFERIVEAICKTYRTKYKLKFYNENQPVINDLNMTKLVRSTAEKVLGYIDRIIPFMSTAGENFSEFADRVPSVFYFVGAGSIEKESHYPHHNPRFNIDEDIMLIGLEMHVRSALEFFNK